MGRNCYNSDPKREDFREMTGESFILGMSRIGLTFAGFATLLSFLRHPNRGWTQAEVNALKLLLEHTMALVFLGILPFPLVFTFGSEGTVFRISSATLASFLVLEFILQHRRLTKATPRRLAYFRYGFQVPCCGFTILALVNVVLGKLSLYAWGLCWLLFPPTFQLMLFLFFFSEGPSSERSKPTTPTEAE
jgi:hypothetical protein